MAPEKNARPETRNSKRKLKTENSKLQVALVEPEIPPNTGNIARLCAATRTPLHIIGVTGFRMDERAVRRAGLDYWPEVQLVQHRDMEAFFAAMTLESRFVYCSTKAEKSYVDWVYAPGDCLVFGRETRGLPEALLRENWNNCVRIPMTNPSVRSLNLATAVAIVLYEALRQTGALNRES
jgi:tRNA (cytidine/uridine-2'-O-)-methyltransferase